MHFFALGTKATLGLILFAVFAASLLLETTSKGAIVPFYIGVVLAMLYFRNGLADAMAFTGLSRDANLLIAFAVFSLAALHVHTAEVLLGLGRVVIDTAFQAGQMFGQAVFRG